MGWKETFEELFDLEKGNEVGFTLNSFQSFDEILKIRETVIYIVKSKEEFRAVFADRHGTIGVTNINKDVRFLTWKVDSEFIGLFNEQIYIVERKQAQEKLEYLSDDPVIDQELALKKIFQFNKINSTRDFI